LEDARAKARASGADGVMLGRAIFGNPFLFAGLNNPDHSELKKVVSPETRLRVMLEHTKLFAKLFLNTKDKSRANIKNFAVMKKHYKAYVNGWDGAKELRVRLMEAETVQDVENLVGNYLESL
jgi:tRNA-dihydrouridine synthase